MDPVDLNYPRQDLSNGGLESFVALLVRWQIPFTSACIGRPIQLKQTYKPFFISKLRNIAGNSSPVEMECCTIHCAGLTINDNCLFHKM